MRTTAPLDELLAAEPAAMTDGELSDWLVAMDSMRSRLEAKALEVAGEWDGRGAWGLDGARSGAAWLAARADLRRATAHGLVRDARLLRALPRSAAAASTHGASKVRAMVSFVNPRTRDAYEEQEALLLEQAKPLTVDQTITMMQFWALHADTEGTDPADPSTNQVHLSRTISGRWTLSGNLDAVTGAELARALDERRDVIARAYRRANDGTHRPHSQLLAEALAMLVKDASRAETEPGSIPAEPSVTAVVDYEYLCEVLATKPPGAASGPGRPPAGNGPRPGGSGPNPNCHIGGTDPIKGETARRLACEAGIHRLIVKGRSTVIDAGRTVRTVTPAMRRAMRDRSPTCEFGHCDIPERWCSAHHIDWWGRDDGETNIDDLAFLCAWHHTLVHEGRWTLRRLESGEIEIRRPDGSVLDRLRIAV